MKFCYNFRFLTMFVKCSLNVQESNYIKTDNIKQSERNTERFKLKV